jgi:two-component system, response regulator
MLLQDSASINSVKYILLVEDNPDDVILTKIAFKRGNVPNKLVVVGNGQEALDFLFHNGRFSNQGSQDKPGLILLDLKLPLVSGLDVLKQIKSNKNMASIPIVVLTCSLEEKDQSESYRLGANDYIRKPISLSDFVQIIKNIQNKWLGPDKSATHNN